MPINWTNLKAFKRDAKIEFAFFCSALIVANVALGGEMRKTVTDCILVFPILFLIQICSLAFTRQTIVPDTKKKGRIHPWANLKRYKKLILWELVILCPVIIINNVLPSYELQTDVNDLLESFCFLFVLQIALIMVDELKAQSL